MPKVSVIIPVYNSEKYISECLDSVLNQTFKDIEIICIDDGSTDKSFDILNRYNIKEKRITLLTQKNLGQSVARNKALEIAKGEYIYFLDSDDYIEPNLIEECIKKLDETQAGLICFNTEVVGDTSSRLFKRAEKYALLKFSGLLTLTGEVRDTLNVYLWNKMFRNDIIQKYKLRFPQNLCYEDISFSKSYFLMVDKIYMDMRRFYHYRIHENSIMTTTYKTKNAILDHFRNWNTILNNISINKDLFINNKDTLEKWFWDYYFMTKSLLKTPIDEELEKLKTEYFSNFEKVINSYQ